MAGKELWIGPVGKDPRKGNDGRVPGGLSPNRRSERVLSLSPAPSTRLVGHCLSSSQPRAESVVSLYLHFTVEEKKAYRLAQSHLAEKWQMPDSCPCIGRGPLSKGWSASPSLEQSDCTPLWPVCPQKARDRTPERVGGLPVFLVRPDEGTGPHHLIVTQEDMKRNPHSSEKAKSSWTQG